VKWVTRKHLRVNRAATAWLIRRFVDAKAEFLFVESEQVAEVQRTQGAIGFDAPGARYPHTDDQGRCSFEVLVEEHCRDDAALNEMARVVHGADLPEHLDRTPESAGLLAISRGFPMVAKNDHDTVEKASFLYDALYASLRQRLESAR
jgi:hypothetical protein